MLDRAFFGACVAAALGCSGGGPAPTQPATTKTAAQTAGTATATPAAMGAAAATATAATAPPLERSPLMVKQAMRLPGEGPVNPLSLRDLAVDASGNILVSGGLRGSLRWGTAQLTSRGDEKEAPSVDAFLGSLDASFRPVWASVADGPDTDWANAVAAGKDLIVSVGHFTGEAEVGGKMLTGRGGSDILITAFEPGGTLRFARGFGSKGHSDATAVAIGERGDIVVGGAFERAIQFDGFPLQSTGVFAATFLIMLRPDGRVVWAKGFGGRGNSAITGIAVDPDGSVVVGGEMGADIEVDVFKLRGKQRGERGFLMRLAPDGKLLWARPFAGVDEVAIHGGGIIAIGAPDDAEVPPSDATLPETWLKVVKLSKDGKVQWARTVAPASQDPKMAVAPSGMIVVATTPHLMTGYNVGRSEAFVTTRSPEGELIASKKLGKSEKSVTCRAVAVRSSGEILVMGGFLGEIDFEKAALSSGGGDGTFLVELEP
jgi:hypothetical protein